MSNLFIRRSCRAYDAKQDDPETLKPILEASTYMPSGMDQQSQYIVAIQDKVSLDKAERPNAATMSNPDVHTFYVTPTEVVVFAENDSLIKITFANLVIGNLLNAANALGIDSCYTGSPARRLKAAGNARRLKRPVVFPWRA